MFTLTIVANQYPADLGLLWHMGMHMLSLTLNGLPSSLIWAWSRTPVRALEQMTLSQWTDTISSCSPDRQSVYSLCPYPKYPLHTRVSVKWTKNPDVYSFTVPLGLCGVCLRCLFVDGLDPQSLVFVRNLSCLLWPPPTHYSIYIYGVNLNEVGQSQVGRFDTHRGSPQARQNPKEQRWSGVIINHYYLCCKKFTSSSFALSQTLLI